jgi:hypothetical protein
VTSPDLPWLRALERTCLAKMGRRDQAEAVLEDLEWQRHADYVDAYYMAVLRNELGLRDGAFAELQRATDENSAWLYQIDVDLKMDSFRVDPRFGRLRASLGPAPS